ERTKSGDWSEPRNLGPPVNSNGNEWLPRLAKNGTLYFGSDRPGGLGATDLYRSRSAGGKFLEPQNLGPAVNSAADEYEPCIAADESFLVFMASGRPDTQGYGDLYLSEQKDGVWTEARRLGPAINGPGLEISPYVTPDGTRFFFSSARRAPDVPPGTRPDRPGNGLGDIYEMPLEALRAPTAAPAPATAATAARGTVLDHVPDAPDPNARYLIYLHGRIVEEQGRRPTHPTYGIYEYDKILEALAGHGAVVISEQRPAQTDVDKFAARVVDQVRTLLGAGVPPERVTVAGFSKGGGIAIRASAFLKDPRVNFVFMAACGDGDFDRADLAVQGRILSIYEANDEIGRSCKNLFGRGAAPGERSEVEVRVGDHHGTFFRVHKEWLDPLLRWVETAQVAAPGGA
ncbi:MAG TPA: hypothetical protein VFQ07_04410, partial [Candidatus Polarisedimenticolia bacterium]|nr:hypothetical protein [Candidatus Polarisedimenticolia bacterium]